MYFQLLLSAKHRSPHSNSLRHNNSDDSILVTSPLIHFYYCPLNLKIRYKFRADTSHEVSALFVIFAFVSQLR